MFQPPAGTVKSSAIRSVVLMARKPAVVFCWSPGLAQSSAHSDHCAPGGAATPLPVVLPVASGPLLYRTCAVAVLAHIARPAETAIKLVAFMSDSLEFPPPRYSCLTHEAPLWGLPPCTHDGL